MKKKICEYGSSGEVFLILLPVFYENETRPAWRKVFKGSAKECKEVFSSFPDSLKATPEENREMKQSRLKEMIFLQSIGRHAAAEKIKMQYHF